MSLFPSGLARPRRALAPVLVLALAFAGVAGGCASSDHAATTTPSDAGMASAPGASAAGMPAVPRGSVTMPTADEVSATWSTRPDYVKALPGDGQAAYAFALARPDALQWVPCYCGCAGMDHRSNLDCFFRRREADSPLQYEEHASFCDICVKTANLVQQQLREGRTMAEIRAAVDATFGGSGAPGTVTPLPPA